MTVVQFRRRKAVPARVLAIVLGCALLGALLTAGTASAASRGYRVENTSRYNLRLITAKPVPTYKCVEITRCIATNYPFAFEGRPVDGSALPAGGTDAWELKYGFDILGGVQYAADLWYQVLGTDDQVHYRIEVFSTANESSCDIVGTTKYGCSAQGLKLQFKNSGPG